MYGTQPHTVLIALGKRAKAKRATRLIRKVRWMASTCALARGDSRGRRRTHHVVPHLNDDDEEGHGPKYEPEDVRSSGREPRPVDDKRDEFEIDVGLPECRDSRAEEDTVPGSMAR